MSEQSAFGDPGDHAEIKNPKNVLAPLETMKVQLYNRAFAISKTGWRIEPIDMSVGQHGVSKQVPMTKDKLTVISYDKPLQHPGLEGIIMQITHSEAVGDPDVIEGEVLTQYAHNTTAYMVSKIHDGLHIDKRTSYIPKGSEREPIIVPKTQEEWDAMFDAYDRGQEARADNDTFEREFGANFFSQQDVEDVGELFDRTFGPETPTVTG